MKRLEDRDHDAASLRRVDRAPQNEVLQHGLHLQQLQQGRSRHPGEATRPAPHRTDDLSPWHAYPRGGWGEGCSFENGVEV